MSAQGPDKPPDQALKLSVEAEVKRLEDIEKAKKAREEEIRLAEEKTKLAGAKRRQEKEERERRAAEEKKIAAAKVESGGKKAAIADKQTQTAAPAPELSANTAASLANQQAELKHKKDSVKQVSPAALQGKPTTPTASLTAAAVPSQTPVSAPTTPTPAAPTTAAPAAPAGGKGQSREMTAKGEGQKEKPKDQHQAGSASEIPTGGDHPWLNLMKLLFGPILTYPVTKGYIAKKTRQAYDFLKGKIKDTAIGRFFQKPGTDTPLPPVSGSSLQSGGTPPSIVSSASPPASVSPTAAAAQPSLSAAPVPNPVITAGLNRVISGSTQAKATAALMPPSPNTPNPDDFITLTPLANLKMKIAPSVAALVKPSVSGPAAGASLGASASADATSNPPTSSPKNR